MKSRIVCPDEPGIQTAMYHLSGVTNCAAIKPHSSRLSQGFTQSRNDLGESVTMKTQYFRQTYFWKSNIGH